MERGITWVDLHGLIDVLLESEAVVDFLCYPQVVAYGTSCDGKPFVRLGVAIVS